MENIISYRNPIFSILIFATIIFIVAIINYTYIVYKKKSTNKKIDAFINSLNKEIDFVDFKTIIEKYTLPIETLIFIATSFYKSGDYDKAIRLCTNLIEIQTNKMIKQDILELLGKTYLKAGFIQRSKDVYLKILEIFPRNVSALNNLLISYELLKEHKEALSILTPLKELGQDIEIQKVYLNSLEISNNATMSIDKKIKNLSSLCKENNFIQKVLIEFISENKISKIWDIDINYKDNIDILWKVPQNQIDFSVVEKSEFLKQLYSAKGYIDSSPDSSIFELNILINLKNSLCKNVDLSFEYYCTKCKHIFPINEHRCHRCSSLFTFKTNLLLIKKNETDINL
jgi:lipopolysaccharide biosynthesis regulator YciM/DNA-directed RNA polymerase subunit RPC12/RpoP